MLYIAVMSVDPIIGEGYFCIPTIDILHIFKPMSISKFELIADAVDEYTPNIKIIQGEWYILRLDLDGDIDGDYEYQYRFNVKWIIPYSENIDITTLSDTGEFEYIKNKSNIRKIQL